MYVHTLEEALQKLDRVIAWADRVAEHCEFRKNQFESETHLLCTLMGIRQIKLANSVKTLMLADMPEAAYILSRVMLEGSTYIWWIFDSPLYENRVKNWVDHVYREVNKITPEVEKILVEKGNLIEMRAAVKQAFEEGLKLKGNKWTVDENGNPVFISTIIQDFIRSGVSPDKTIDYSYSQYSSYVHWSIASFPVLATETGPNIIEETETAKAAAVITASNALIVLITIVENRTVPTSK